MNIIIITGGSKGIGNALVEKYASENYKVYALSRTPISFQNVTHIPIDMSDLRRLTEKLAILFEELKSFSISSITLINNAGRLGTIANIENISPDDITKSMNVNIIASMVITNLFINFTKKYNCKKKVINISSGAATKPYEGWSIYCASKAALDMFTKTVALEQEILENGVKCIALYPGVVDTNMQTQIRGTEGKDFRQLHRFLDLKKNNALYTSEYVAQIIYKIDQEDSLSHGAVFDIRNINQ